MATYTTNLNLKKPEMEESLLVADINANMDTIDTAYNTLNTKTNTQNISGATAEMLNCTATFTSNNVRVRSLLGGALIQVKVQLRGSVTAVSNPAYSQIRVSGLPNISSYYLNDAICTLREYANCFAYDVGSIIVSPVTNEPTKLYIQHQRIGGTNANSWKTCDNFYIDCNIVLIK